MHVAWRPHPPQSRVVVTWLFSAVSGVCKGFFVSGSRGVRCEFVLQRLVVPDVVGKALWLGLGR